MFKTIKNKTIGRKLLDFIYPKIGLKRFIKYIGYKLGRMKSTPYEIASGFACGAAISFTPFLGMHFIISAILAYILRGSIITSAIGTIVGNPLTFPFIWALVYKTGSFIIDVDSYMGDIGEMFLFALEKISEINSWHLLLLTKYSIAIDTLDKYLDMWEDLFNIIYVFVIGCIPWVIIVWIGFFVVIYSLVKKYKKSRKKK